MKRLALAFLFLFVLSSVSQACLFSNFAYRVRARRAVHGYAIVRPLRVLRPIVRIARPLRPVVVQPVVPVMPVVPINANCPACAGH